MIVLIKSDDFIEPITFPYTLEIKLYSKYEYTNMRTDVSQILYEFFLLYLIW